MNPDDLSKLLDDDLDLEALRKRALAQITRDQSADREERRRQAKLVRSAFVSEAAFRDFLAWLEQRTVKARYDADETGVANAAAYGLQAAKREGRASIYFMLCDVFNTEDDDEETANAEVAEE